MSIRYVYGRCKLPRIPKQKRDLTFGGTAMTLLEIREKGVEAILAEIESLPPQKPKKPINTAKIDFKTQIERFAAFDQSPEDVEALHREAQEI
jgi:hypothetical protein